MRPFSVFSVAVRIEVPRHTGTALCEGQFAECDGLEVNLDVGAANCGTLTLRRGMTDRSDDLWDWFDAQQHAAPREPRSDSRANATIVLKTATHKESARLLLRRCRLTKLKAPFPRAQDDVTAIEELQLRYESLAIEVFEGA